MSTQRNKQKISRLASSAPASTAPKKHVHFREIRSAEPKRGYEHQLSIERTAIRNGSRFLNDPEDSISQYNWRTLSDGSISTPNTPDSAYSQSFYRLPEDLLARGDFIAYQSADASDFFNSTNHTKPKRVSEICLVNDHYMLVKIPAIRWEHEKAMDSIAEEESSVIENREQGRGFLRYFPCQRNRRVLPAATVPRKGEPTASATTDNIRSILRCPLAHCWRTNERPEVFEARTKMFGAFWKQKMHGQVITIQPSKNNREAPLDLRVKSVHISEHGAPVGENNNQIDTGVFGSPLHSPTKATFQPLSAGALQTSLHHAVALEQHATWVNDDKPGFERFARKETPLSVADSKNSKTKRRTNVFHWFLKRAKTSKPKSKIHAVVYKTYFVRLKKPPDEMCPHCGRTKDGGVSAAVKCKRKRCHSATF